MCMKAVIPGLSDVPRCYVAIETSTELRAELGDGAGHLARG